MITFSIRVTLITSRTSISSVANLIQHAFLQLYPALAFLDHKSHSVAVFSISPFATGIGVSGAFSLVYSDIQISAVDSYVMLPLLVLSRNEGGSVRNVR